jgi:hypothetical protein
MGVKFELTGAAFVNPAFPKIYDDRMMSDGSLFLFDPSHTNGHITGVPADGAVVPNIAHEIAAAQIGSGDATTLGGLFFNNLAATDGVLQRTSKLGLHGIMSQATAASSRGAGIRMSDPIKQRILDVLPAHDLYVSMWTNRSRVALAGSGALNPADFIGTNLSASTSNYWAILDMAAIRPTTSENIGSIASPGHNSLGPTFKALAVDSFKGTEPTVLSNFPCRQTWGAPASTGWSGQNNKAASYVLYRLYIEDLTVAGRTYAEAMALDKALFDAAFAEGGRFYDDSFSDPATTLA